MSGLKKSKKQGNTFIEKLIFFKINEQLIIPQLKELADQAIVLISNYKKYFGLQKTTILVIASTNKNEGQKSSIKPFPVVNLFEKQKYSDIEFPENRFSFLIYSVIIIDFPSEKDPKKIQWKKKVLDTQDQLIDQVRKKYINYSKSLYLFITFLLYRLEWSLIVKKLQSSYTKKWLLIELVI